MYTFLGAADTADDWQGTAYAGDAEGAVALRRLLHDTGMVPAGHIVFGVDLWLTNDGGGKAKHKAPYIEVFVLDTAGFADTKSAAAGKVYSADTNPPSCPHCGTDDTCLARAPHEPGVTDFPVSPVRESLHARDAHTDGEHVTPRPPFQLPAVAVGASSPHARSDGTRHDA